LYFILYIIIILYPLPLHPLPVYLVDEQGDHFHSVNLANVPHLTYSNALQRRPRNVRDTVLYLPFLAIQPFSMSIVQEGGDVPVDRDGGLIPSFLSFFFFISVLADADTLGLAFSGVYWDQVLLQVFSSIHTSKK
jgi:hypothetical protein